MRVPWRRSTSLAGVALVATLIALVFSAPGAFASSQYIPHSDSSVLPGHLVPALRGQSPTGATPTSQALHLSIALRPRNQDGLRASLATINRKGSSAYHHYLAKGQFNAQYAPTSDTVAAVSAFLTANGMTVETVSANHLLIDAQGTVGAIERAFDIRIANFSYQGRTVYAPLDNPSVPNDLATAIMAINGLDNVAIPHTSMADSRGAAPAREQSVKPHAGSGPLGGFTPTDLRTAYDATPLLATSDGTGQTVALFELAGFDSNDVDQYLSYYSLGAPMYQAPILVDGASNTPGAGSVEVELDMELVSALAPGATQLVYIGPRTTQGSNDTYAQIVSDDSASVVSTSWGECEYDLGTAELATLDTIFQQGAIQGQAFFAASGDRGAYDCGGTNLGVDSPADDPNVVGVGGTTLYTDDNGAYNEEFAWSCGAPTCTDKGPRGDGSGGGLSTYFNAPTYQNGPGVVNQYSNGMREVPDVSAAADPATPYSIYCTVTAAGCNPPGWITPGGTSGAAPVWAGIAALLNEYLANQDMPTIGSGGPDLYTLFNTTQAYPAYHDVTQGYNLYYLAGSGYDLATGIGSPDVWNMARDLAAGLSNQQVSRRWYFAEGYTGTGFTEYLTLANPNAVAAHVTVQYLQGAGGTITKTYTVSAASRKTLTVNNEIGAGKNVSLVVTADTPIVAERPMYFTYTGLSGYTIPGGSDVLGATHLDTQYDFAYVDTSTGHDTWFTILNPNSVTMTVNIQYLAASGSNAGTFTHTVPANSRGTVRVSAEGIAAGSYSALVTLSAPGLVERPFYEVDSVTGRAGSTDVVGVPQPLTNWYFAEGYSSPNFSERYILANPTYPPKTVTLTFSLPDGSSVNDTVTLNNGQQQIIDASSVLGPGGVNNSVHVQASGPILAERFMSFLYTGPVGSAPSSNIPGATEALGAAQPSETYYFAEGYTGGNFAEYLTIQNPQSQPANVQVTYLPASGSGPVEVTYLVPANSRYTVNTSSAMPQQSFSMVVQSTVPIVAERPMYFSFGGAGLTGGSDIIGYVAQPSWSRFPDADESTWKGAMFGSGSNDVWAFYGTYGGNGIEHWDGTTWSNVSSSGSSKNGSATSPTDAWIVGWHGASQDGDDTRTTIEHWDGTAWNLVNSPNVSGAFTNQLYGVVALSSSNVWAVGEYGPQSGAQQTLVEHWDGANWSIVASPNVGTGSNYLEKVVAVSPNDIWAVGYYVDTGSNKNVTLIEHWNGASWSVATSPSPGSNGTLASISAISASDIWAVGQYYGVNNLQQTLALHWNGTVWSVVSTPSPSNASGNGNSLFSVYARTTSDIWAVGYTANTGDLIEHWDGAHWSVVTSPPGGSGINGVIAFDATDAWAGGSYIEHYG